MKELKMPEMVELTEFDIKVRPYLLFEECYDIAVHTSTFDNYLDKQVARDCSVLKFATDMTEEDLKKYMYSELYNSGLVEQVRKTVVNFDDIYKIESDLNSLENRATILMDTITHFLVEVEKKLPKKLSIDKIMDGLGKTVTQLKDAESKLEKVFEDVDKK